MDQATSYCSSCSTQLCQTQFGFECPYCTWQHSNPEDLWTPPTSDMTVTTPSTVETLDPIPAPTILITSTRVDEAAHHPGTNYCLEGMTMIVESGVTVTEAEATCPVPTRKMTGTEDLPVTDWIIKTPTKNQILKAQEPMSIRKVHQLKKKYVSLKNRKKLHDTQTRELINAKSQIMEQVQRLKQRIYRLNIVKARAQVEADELSKLFEKSFPTLQQASMNLRRESNNSPGLLVSPQAVTSSSPSTAAPNGQNQDFSDFANVLPQVPYPYVREQVDSSRLEVPDVSTFTCFSGFQQEDQPEKLFNL